MTGENKAVRQTGMPPESRRLDSGSEEELLRDCKKPGKDILTAVLVGLCCCFVYVALMHYAVVFENGEWNRNAFATGNELSHFYLVRALVEERSFSTGDVSESAPGDSAVYGGQLYSNKPPGFAFLAVPGYTVYFHFLHPSLADRPVPNLFPLISTILGGICVALIYLLARDLGASQEGATFSAVVAGLGTILIVYSTSFMNHVASATFLLLAIWAAFRYRVTESGLALVLASFCLGYSILINYSAAVLILPVLAYLVLILWHKGFRLPARTGFTAILAGGSALVLLAYYQFRCFGSPFATAYDYYQPPSYVRYDNPAEAYFGGSFWNGFWGFLFGWGKGMFVYTPVLLFAIPGFLVQLRDRQRLEEMIVLATTALLNVLVFAPYRYWFGGHSIGPRHILPAIVLSCILMFPSYDRSLRWAKLGMAVTALFSTLVHTALTILSHDPDVLAQTWVESNGYQLGNLYTEILPQFLTAEISIFGLGLFRVMKLITFVLIPLLAGYMGCRWRRSKSP